MISTSKIRRPPSVIRDERQKLRRVCFLESSTGNVTEGMVGDISESTVRKDREERPPTPRPNHAKYDSRFNGDVKPETGPTAASTSHLFHESHQPSLARLALGRGPAMTAKLQGSPPPPPPPPSGNSRVDVFDPVSKAYELRRGDRDERDGSEQPWLQSFGIGVLVAALVAAVITLALTADRSTAMVNRKEASPRPRELEEFAAASGNRIVAPIESRRAAARIGAKVMTRRRKVALTTASALRKRETRTQPVPRLQTENQTRPVDRRCGRRFYTYCEQEIREAYYDDRSRSCAWSERGRVRVCNRGANRFPNLGTCLDSCARDPSRERCFESVLLTDCSRPDVVEERWFFDGARCVQWNFPMGDCPSSRGGRAFMSLRECSMTCLQRPRSRRRRLDGVSVPQRSRCLAPLAVTCDPRDIRYPYFADMNARGSARCFDLHRLNSASAEIVVTAMARFMFIVAIAFLAGTSVHAHTNRPNMVFFLTDDLDLELGSMMKPLVKTRQLIADGGVTFANAYVTTPLCCPSRSSILTGRYVHNVGVFNNSLSGGCSSQHWQRGPERSAFAVDLQRAGYETFYAGKYLNRYGHKKAGGVQHVPPGWTNWNGLVGNSVYYNYTLSINGTAEKHGDSPDKDYLTDVLRAKALSFLEGRTDQRRPFFMMLSTPAPHAPFTPAVRHRDAFPNVKAPRTPAFNISVNGTKHWLVRQAIYPIPEDVVSWIDEAYRNR
ncbi:hypothetical protein HPB52_013085 [Rhipicephalus sanguineus]|uniref:Sulfatase N-terminal domain-containing protein n=1 Tax=Rhipicephalus sanguineus TaxID=34632 RepID=A0A9D4PMQ3_RHISA|nr:hypothetical protein HPB52_013085 [Rhipicephalus sanguineus]